jgi:hypothetical protein
VFWLGFTAMWLICIQGSPNSVPQFLWVGRMLPGNRGGLYDSQIADTVRACGFALLATVAGLIGTYIYDHRPQRK